ncbi:hypothetical protein SUGI_0055090 [Cryptomeria japonica]|nr:hypothetical protein SUGI_0055090 [Cryptomeria japonica]
MKVRRVPSDTGEANNLRRRNNPEAIQEIDVDEEISLESDLMEHLALICRIIGLKKNTETIKKWVYQNWKTDYILKFLPKNFFVVIFESLEGKEKILQEGVWPLDGNPFYIPQWHPNFHPYKTNPYDSKKWIMLYNLPIEYW